MGNYVKDDKEHLLVYSWALEVIRGASIEDDIFGSSSSSFAVKAQGMFIQNKNKKN